MSIRVIRSGVLDTIQDRGRTGFGRWGINVGGVMDTYATDIANALVGNDEDCAVIEFHFPASELFFENGTLLSITGADFSAELNGREIPQWRTIVIPPQSVLSFKRRKNGARAYLAVKGGVSVKKWLESRSTNLKVGAGGFEGRKLRAGDFISTTDDQKRVHSPMIFPWSVNTESAYRLDTIRIIKGKEFEVLSEESMSALTSSDFSIHSSSDRMASHLVHEAFILEKKMELFSSAVSFGTIQLPPSGKMIVLMADHQTTGGYPRIAHIASACLPRFSQMTPGEKFRFEWITLADAEKMLFSLRTEIENIRNIVRAKLQTWYAKN